VEDLELVCVRKEGTSNIAFEFTDCVDFVENIARILSANGMVTTQKTIKIEPIFDKVTVKIKVAQFF